MDAPIVRVAPNVQKFENILSGASLGAATQSGFSEKFAVHGALGVVFVLSADADPSAAATSDIGYYFANNPTTRRITVLQHTANDTNFPAADIAEGATLRVVGATGGANNNGNRIVAEFMDIRVTNGGAAAMLNFRVDAHVIY